MRLVLPGGSSAGRRAFDTFTRVAAAVLFLALLAGLLGLLLRDRIPVVALLMYVPLLPLGIAAIVWELVARGRSLRRWRWMLGAIGVVAGACGLMTSLGRRASPAPPPPAGIQPINVLQWNVRWGGSGGGEDGTGGRWQSLCHDIAGRAPDMLVLNECPGSDRLNDLLRVLGPEWTGIHSASANGAAYRYRLLVAARWPVKLERQQPIPSGFVMQAVVRGPGGDVRVLVVDGESPPWFDRTPRLRAVAQILRDAEQAGAPVDVVAGDFNAVGRSVGFAEFSAAGFVSAGATQPGWRATWPAIAPLYDIDHVWVDREWTIVSFNRFTNRVSDHRGHFARIVRTQQ
jgi:endonuclease/exonuclease/phosphatase family metal-dependent hydrolase